MTFVAKDQKSHGACSGRVHALDRRPNLRDPGGVFHVGHRWQRVHTVGSVQQRRGGEVVGIADDVRWISSTAGTDDLLLCSHCLCTA